MTRQGLRRVNALKDDTIYLVVDWETRLVYARVPSASVATAMTLGILNSQVLVLPPAETRHLGIRVCNGRGPGNSERGSRCCSSYGNRRGLEVREKRTGALAAASRGAAGKPGFAAEFV